MRTTVYLDDDAKNALDELPRKVNASKLIRWMSKALTTDEKKWDRLIKEDQEIRDVQEFLRPRLMQALGINEKKLEKMKTVKNKFAHDDNEKIKKVKKR